MSEHTAEIEVTATGNGTVVVGGVDVSGWVRGFSLDASVGEVTRLSLDLVLTRGAKLKADGTITIHPDTIAILERLGWTPPDSLAVEVPHSG